MEGLDRGLGAHTEEEPVPSTHQAGGVSHATLVSMMPVRYGLSRAMTRSAVC